MKKTIQHFLILMLMLIGVISCKQKPSDQFTLDVSIENVNYADTATLTYMQFDGKKWIQVSDSAKIVDGKFHFQGKIKELTSGYFNFYDKDDVHNIGISIPIYLEPTTIKLSIDANDLYAYKLLGTSVDKESAELQNILATQNKIHDQIGDSIQNVFDLISKYEGKHKIVDSLMQRAYYFKEKLTISAKNMDSIRLEFLGKQISSPIAPHLIQKIAETNLITIDTVITTYSKLAKNLQASLLGKLAAAQIKQSQLLLKSENIKIGEIAPDFTKETINGDTIRLSDYRDKKYVLLDFWASWCGPCLKQIPQIKNIQETYAIEGLQIIGISTDGDKDEWKNVIAKHEMSSWIHVLSSVDPHDYFVNSNDIDEIYNIQTIPRYILIDKQGKIVADWQHIGNNELSFIKIY